MDAPVIPSFRYTKPATLHHSPVGRLVDWLERYVNGLFPDNGIENWYVPKRMPDMGPFLAREDALPDGIHHVVSSVAPGSNEGDYVYVGLNAHDGTTLRLASVKSFGGSDECWAVARLCSEALTAIFGFHEQPVFVDLWLKLPRDQSWHRNTSLIGEVCLREIGADSARVIAGDCVELDALQFRSPNAILAREAYLADWETLLRAQGLRVRREKIGEGPCLAV